MNAIFPSSSGTAKCRSGDQHFRHPAGHWAHVAKHDHTARRDLSLFHGTDDVARIIEANRLTFEGRILHARHFEHDAIGSQIAETDLHVGEWLVAVFFRDDQILTGRRLRYVFQIFRHGLTGHGDAGSVQQSAVEQMLQQNRRATNFVQIDHRALSRAERSCRAPEFRGRLSADLAA